MQCGSYIMILRYFNVWFHHACPQVTAVLEILQPTYQHVVDLSHLQRGELNFIAWTLPYDDDDKGRVHADSYCAMNPQVCIDNKQDAKSHDNTG